MRELLVNEREGKPTLKSIAEAAGVHPSTVSRALMGKPGTRIPAATIARINRAARELNYEPNPWAQSLRTQRAMMVGLAIPRLTDVVLAQMFEAAQWRARDYGYQTITVSAEAEGSHGAAVKGLIDRRVDGVILATATLRDAFLPEIERLGVPFVLLNRSSRDYPSVCGDDRLGGYLATRHLIATGHTRIGHISGPMNSSTGKFRAQGYKQALQEAGIPFDPSLVAKGDFDVDSAQVAAEALLSLPDRPTAVFAVNDVSALATMAVARKHGLRIPDDVAIIGYNDSDVSSLLPIPLSSVRVPLLDMGRLAVDLLMRRINGEEIGSVLMTPELVLRESSGGDDTSGDPRESSGVTSAAG